VGIRAEPGYIRLPKARLPASRVHAVRRVTRPRVTTRWYQHLRSSAFQMTSYDAIRELRQRTRTKLCSWSVLS